jgi:hypothetical protein
MSALAPTMQAFFSERLINQRQASPHTIAAYRDTFRLLLGFAQQRTGIKPHALDIEVLDAVLVTAFLDHLERDRRNSPRTRGWRPSARSTTTPRSGTPSTRPRSRACSRSRPSATTARSSATSTSPRPRRCSPPPIKAAGSADVTTR